MANRNETENQDCWRFMTTGEKVLLFLLFMTLTALVTFLIIIFVLLLQNNTICNTPDCVKASTKFLDIINFKADPCEDFTSFACNKKEGSESRKQMLIQEFVKGLDNSSLVTPRKFYQACTNSTAIEEQGIETVQVLLENLGGWPLLLGQKWNESAFHWLQFMTKLRNSGLKSDWFLEFSWQQNENGTKLLKIGVPTKVDTIPYSRQQIYYQMMVSVAVDFDSSEILAWKEIGKVAYFENNLLSIREAAINRSLIDSDDFDVIVSVAELNRIWPEVNLVTLLNDLANGYTVFTQNSLLVLALESYISDLNTLLARTSRRTQANFFIWKIIETLLPYLSQEIRKKYEYYSEIGTREDHCMEETINRFYGAIEAEYVSKYVDEPIQKELKEMVTLINNEELNVVIGDPEAAFVNKDFTFVSDNVIEMVNAARFEEENDFFKCLNTNLTCDYEKYGHHPNSSEIKFDCNETIYIPNGLVQSDWYDFHQPNYLNYAGLGVAVAKAIKTCLETSPESDELNAEDSAYLGYLKWIHQYGLERHLPGLNYTTKQLFWIYSSSVSCLETVPDSIYFLQDFQC